jgi:uncharacterized protein YbbK (DUF523 family)
MHSVLISACLLGDPVRYDGRHKRADSKILQRWLDEGRVVPVCPEVAAGLPVPRPPAEISGGSGESVIDGRAQVRDPDANDMSAEFIAGANHALHLARSKGIRIAILKEGSPSCGSGHIHDGTFSGTNVPGQGVTSARLERAGIRVFNEKQFAEAQALLLELEAHDTA